MLDDIEDKRIEKLAKDDPAGISKEIAELTANIEKLGLIHERYDDTIFKDRKMVDKLESTKKEFKPKEPPSPASTMPDSDEVQKKIDEVEAQLNMSDDDMKAKLEQEAFESGLEKAPEDEEDDTCEIL